MYKQVSVSASGRVDGTDITICKEALEKLGRPRALVIAQTGAELPQGHGTARTLLVWTDGTGATYIQIPFLGLEEPSLKVSPDDLKELGIRPPEKREARVFRIASLEVTQTLI